MKRIGKTLHFMADAEHKSFKDFYNSLSYPAFPKIFHIGPREFGKLFLLLIPPALIVHGLDEAAIRVTVGNFNRNFIYFVISALCSPFRSDLEPELRQTNSFECRDPRAASHLRLTLRREALERAAHWSEDPFHIYFFLIDFTPKKTISKLLLLLLRHNFTWYFIHTLLAIMLSSNAPAALCTFLSFDIKTTAICIKHNTLCSNHTIRGRKELHNLRGSPFGVSKKTVDFIRSHIFHSEPREAMLWPCRICVLGGQRENTVKLTRVAQSQQFQK